jgi:hypothetical protein
MIREEMMKYEQITGKSAEHIPIVKIGAFLDGYDAAKQEPYEKFESTKDHIYKLAGDYKCWDNRLTRDEALELCHILEEQQNPNSIRINFVGEEEAKEFDEYLKNQQKPILDKIKGEIDEARFIDKDTKLCKNANASGLEVAMQIINKYKTESEV